jgi:hypothetical protein
VTATCPNPACNWPDPIFVAALVRVPLNGWRAFLPRKSGSLCRCPHCETMFTVSASGIRRVGKIPVSVQAEAVDSGSPVHPKKPAIVSAGADKDMRWQGGNR